MKSSRSREASIAARAKILCQWGAKCKRSSCDYRHPPVCRNYKSGNGCIHGQRCLFRLAQQESSKRVPKERLLLRKRSVQGCVSHDSDPRKSILRKAGEWRLNASAGHTIKFSGATWYQIQIRERKVPSRGVFHKGEPHERNPFAPRFEERTPEETSRPEGYARKAAWNLERYTSSKQRQSYPILLWK